ncbi:hypothetical protein PRUPE_7G062600 [Prunus persica]|uniref:Uncharacterized protein n=1 Tax=Prunus persica TaxID=3760 RepID=M5VWR1_PRUPE|nr:putative disease resistance protein RGA1 [Prunus persica]ONH95306.1 hypothetical protein PRUPE_7G062600 [Prunus persica]
MAEVAFPLAAKLIEKLGSIASEQISLAWSVKADLKKLQRTMSTIKDVLLDAEQKQAHNQQIRSWLRQLKDVFLDADDLLDEFECEALRREVVETFHGTTGKVRRFFSRSNPIAFRLRVGHQIKEIRERLDELKSNKAIFDSLTSIDHHGSGGDHHERVNVTHSFVRASKVIGRESEKKQIINLLMEQGDDNQSGNGNVSVIPIVGIGGLGKTTLAKLVYDDERVCFEKKMWVSVSVDFEITRLIKMILSSASDTEMSDKLTLDQLQGRLRHALKDKKFLLVLDDVWNEDRIKWSELRDLLIEGAKSGSKILVTTRNTWVAEMMGTIPTNINLQFLSFEDCLSLFVECAFKEGRDKDYPNLFEMGKDIVRKCGGVPLAVKTLGSQLHSKTDEREWKLVRDSEIWKLEREGASHILPALRLSYTQLPPHLRLCLAYCSHLPKDQFQFSSFHLIRYWMAHGILDQSRFHGNMELEDIGELYFKDLCARSFFQNVNDRNIYCRFDMHDLIHDLVQSIAQGECFTVKSANTKDISENVRHLTVLEAGHNVSTTLQKLNKVRTLISAQTKIDESFMRTCFSGFKYLRVLQLPTCSLQVLPSSIGSLKHLRYLGISFNEAITKLPSAICKLQSLQTLRFLGCDNLEELPRDISKLLSLTSLELTTKQTSFPKNGVGCLKSLRFLGIVKCSNLTSLPRETSYLASLQTLWIVECKQLDLGKVNYQGPQLRLQKLFIRDVSRMVALPEWFQKAANTLQVLVIRMCENLEALPDWLENFTSLTKLVISSCQKLSSLPEGIRSLTSLRLRELVIEDCPKLERRC